MGSPGECFLRRFMFMFQPGHGVVQAKLQEFGSSRTVVLVLKTVLVLLHAGSHPKPIPRNTTRAVSRCTNTHKKSMAKEVPFCSGKGPLHSTSTQLLGIWGFPRIRGTILGVPIIRTIVIGVHIGSQNLGKLPYTDLQASGFGVLARC